VRKESNHYKTPWRRSHRQPGSLTLSG